MICVVIHVFKSMQTNRQNNPPLRAKNKKKTPTYVYNRVAIHI